MSKAWPSDRKFVDANGKILDAWNGPLQQLRPLLALSVEDFTTLQALIAAAQETEEGEAENIFDLPIDASPDFAVDYAIGFKNSLQAGRKYPLTAFRSSLLYSADLSGNASVTVTVPTTYPHARLVLRGFSFSTNAECRFSLSENGGSTSLPASFEVFNHASIFGADTNNTAPNLTPSGGSAGSAVFSAVIDIHDIAGLTNKFAKMAAVLDSSGSAYVGNYIFTSTSPINLIQFNTTAGTFDAGTVELWGLP